MPYFNYEVHAVDAGAASWWERRAFVRAWWALGRQDDRWTPPPYAAFQRDLNPRHNDHLARLRAQLIHIDALHRTGLSRSRTDQQEIPLTSVFERPLAAAFVATDPRRRDQTAHLGQLHTAGDAEALDRLFGYLAETLRAGGGQRVIGPVGLSPHLGSGVLADAWDAAPPRHTPNNPPYLPEMLERRARLLQTGRLYEAATAAGGGAEVGGLQVKAFAVARLADDLRPLLVAAVENQPAGFPPPDAAEAAFLLRWAGPGAVGGLATVAGAPVGFVLLAPDDGARLRAARGGRPLGARAWLALLSRRPTIAGRLLFGGVLPAARRQGVGRALWAWALASGRAQGWRTLTVGPVWSPPGEPAAAAAFLRAQAAAARQTYRLYEWSI